MTAPCQWPVSRGTCLPAANDSEIDQVRLQECIDTAVGILWSFTGRRFGCCPRLIRPCPRQCDTPSWSPGFSFYPELDGGIWRNISCSCGPTCAVGGPGVVHLPGPVCSIESVTIDGAIIPSAGYVLEGDRLYSTVGEWPTQDLTAPAGSPNTWTVTYGQGVNPPAGAGQMVARLAKEFWDLCQTGKCQLPPRVQSVTRRGVNVQMSDPVELFDDMRTGIPEVDMWVMSVNPTKLHAPAMVSSPDYPSGGW